MRLLARSARSGQRLNGRYGLRVRTAHPFVRPTVRIYCRRPSRART
jgi:hypothetical protein